MKLKWNSNEPQMKFKWCRNEIQMILIEVEMNSKLIWNAMNLKYNDIEMQWNWNAMKLKC